MAAWLFLAEAKVRHATVQKMEAPSLNARRQNCKCYKLKAKGIAEGCANSFTHKEAGFEHASAASEKCFEFTPSRTSENALLAGRANICYVHH